MSGRRRNRRVPSGVGRGNWGGEGAGERVNYLTEFNDMFTLLCGAPASELYDPTVRSICAALGLDGDTFHRYRKGVYKLPRVVKAHMYALLAEEPPPYFYWDYVDEFCINPVFRVMEDTDEWENVLEITFNQTIFVVRPFRMDVNRRFREVIFLYTGELTPHLDREAWKPILDAALRGGYSGRCAAKKAEEYERRIASWREDLLTPSWKRIALQPRSPSLPRQPPSPRVFSNGTVYDPVTKTVTSPTR
jgi:hypothetical protein